jgi:choline kinase
MPHASSAVILAAGMGTRLRGIQPALPKGMLQIGGASLIRRSIEHLYAVGITSILVVTGYRADAYRAFFESEFPEIKTVDNPDYARTGSMHSLSLAEPLVSGDFLLLESDLLYERRALTELVRQPSGDYVLLSGETKQGDEVYAYGYEGRLSLLTKIIQSGREPLGEFTGISRLRSAFFKAMCTHYRAHIRFPSNYHYDDCLSDLSAQLPLHALRIRNLVWGEIDDPLHYQRAVSQLLPIIDAAETRG